MRKGVQDIAARAELSQQVNERHATFLASTLETEPVGKLVEPLCEAVQWRGRRVRGLNPWASADVKLLEIISRGEFILEGFRNRDLRVLLHGPNKEAVTEERRRSAAVTRQLRMLQAHGLIEKQKQSHRYVVTSEGQRAITALLSARRSDTAALTKAA